MENGPEASDCISHAAMHALGDALRIDLLHRETAQRVTQRFDQLLRSTIARGVDHQPAAARIDPRTRDATSAQGARAQLIQHLHLQSAHLAAPHREALALRLGAGAPLGFLPHDRGGQQLLIDAERKQMMLAERVQKAISRRRRHPSHAPHLERTARLQRAACQLLLQGRRAPVPIGGQAIDGEILEPHGIGMTRKAAEYSHAAA